MTLLSGVFQWSVDNKSLLEEASRESEVRRIGIVRRDNFQRVFLKSRAEKLNCILRKM